MLLGLAIAMPGRVSRDTPRTILVDLHTDGQMTLVMRLKAPPFEVGFKGLKHPARSHERRKERSTPCTKPGRDSERTLQFWMERVAGGVFIRLGRIPNRDFPTLFVYYQQTLGRCLGVVLAPSTLPLRHKCRLQIAESEVW
jgi:hypothetical protein